MANNQVLLLQPINGLGAEGDTVTVKAGFARNFLLPRNLALPITQANKRRVESLLKAVKPESKRNSRIHAHSANASRRRVLRSHANRRGW